MNRRRTNKEQVRFAMRSIVLGVFFTLCIVGLLFQIWYLQNLYGDQYAIESAAQLARRNINRNSEVFAPVRGGFVDRNNQPITGTEQVFTVALDVEALHKRYLRGREISPTNDIRQEIFEEITKVLDVSQWELEQMFATDPITGELLLTTGRNWRILQRDVPEEIARPLARVAREINLEQTSLRWYPDPHFAPQVLGFSRGDAVWGLESFYRDEIMGQQGRRIWVQGETEIVPVRDGYTIVTTLDSDIQRLAQDYVNKTLVKHPADFVAMIVMNPMTSEILAMAQAPTFSLEDPFNPDYFTDTELSEVWDALDDSQRSNRVMSLWRNYHTTRSNEPGSIFKPFVIAAAIEEGVITPQNQFHCSGRREISDQIVWCHNRDWGCGSLTLRSAIFRSCNMAMVDINRILGRDLFYRYRGDFGFGERTGIDLPGEECVSSPYVMYPYHRLLPVEMATSSMGQGFNTTTIQMINGYAALINGGNLRRPYLVSHIIDSQGTRVHETQPTIVRRVISPETSDYIRNELRYVVEMRSGVGETGTGWRSHIPGYAIGGKTGTAQQGIRGGGEYVLTFVAFLPIDNPQFLVLMTIDRINNENDRFAGSTVAPIMRDFLLDLIRLRNIQPTGEAEITAAELINAPMPNYEGMRLAEAVSNVVNIGMGGYLVVGGGTVVSHHWPAPGHPIPENSPVIFYTDPDTRIPERMISVPTVAGLTADTANLLLQEVGLPAILFTNRSETSNAESQPFTSRPEPIDESTAAPSAPLPYIIYQQFPAAGSEIERGTQVVLRAR